MRSILIRSTILGAFLIAVLASASPIAAADFAASASVTPVKWNGACPHVFTFKGTITYKGNQKKQEVQYKWKRSDGAFSPIDTIYFSGPGTKPVKDDTWTLSAEGMHWEAIEIVYPTSLISNHAEFDLKCGNTAPPAAKEDCVSFNPATTEVKNINGSWKIVDGSHWMFDFGAKKDEALKGLSIIKHYQANQSCFVGRPNPSFQYLLVSGNAPAGAFAGEDCLGFNINTIEVKLVSGHWKIVDGNHWMYDFASNEAEARQAFAIIKKHGFTHSCYVGRPGPSLEYLRK